jgi:integrase
MNLKLNDMVIEGSKVIDYDMATTRGMHLIRSGHNKTLGLLILCGVNFGLRITDLLGISYDQLKSGEFVVNEQKTGKRRVIRVNQTIKVALRHMIDEPRYQLGGMVFVSQKGSVYSPQHVNRLLKKVFGEGYSSHGLRKGFGRRLYEKKDKDLAIVQMQLQHNNPADTLRYIGVTQEKLDECFDDLI